MPSWSRLLVALILAVLLGPAASGAISGGAGPVAPGTGAPTWARDLDGDGIDDAIASIEALGPVAALGPDGRLRYAVRDGPEGLRYDVFLRLQGPPSSAFISTVSSWTGGAVRSYPIAEVVHVVGVPAALLPRLVALPDVWGIELERTVHPTLGLTMGTSLVNRSTDFGPGARERWKVDGRGAVIAFFDSGIDVEHAAFDPLHYLGGYDATLPLNTISGLPYIGTPLSERDPDDDDAQTHGTFVASVAVGANDDFRGVAPGAYFLDVKVMRDTHTPLGTRGTSSTPYGVGSMVLEGFEFVRRYNAGESHLGEPAKGPVRIISMSLAESGPDPDGSGVVSHAVNRMVDHGIIVVAAAGNCGPASGCEVKGANTIPAPGAAKRAITVTAMDHAGTMKWDDDEIAGYASQGPNGGEPKPNVAAFGSRVTAARGASGFDEEAEDAAQTLSGTSVATPVVTGVVALLLDADRSLTPERVKEILMQTARDVGEPGWDPAHGAGVVNPIFAVGVALGLLDTATEIDARGQPVMRVPMPTVVPTPTPTPVNRTVVNQAPRVAFDVGPSTPRAGLGIVFIDRSVDPEGDRIVSRVWDFGDGSVGRGQRVAHTYDRPGEYRVKLTVTDVHGLAGSGDRVVRVLPATVEVTESPTPAVLLLFALAAFVGAMQRSRRPS